MSRAYPEPELGENRRFSWSIVDSIIESREREELEWKPRKEEWLVVFSIFLLYLMVALDATIVVPVLPAIASDLHGTSVQSFWVGTSFLLTNAVFQPFIATLSDIFGRRALLLVSLIFFTCGTFIACLADNYPVLLAGRSIQGTGAGGVLVLGYIIFTDIIPLRQRAKFTAVVQIAWAIGTILGPLIGGLFVEHATWRWIFYINFPFCAIGFVIVPLTVKLKMKEASFKEKIMRVDWVGGVLFIGSTTAFLIAISWGGTQFRWDSAQTLTPLVIGIVGMLSTLWWETGIANQPFLRISLFYSRSAIAAYLCALIQGIELFSGLYYIPLYLESVQGRSPVLTGLSMFAVTCALVPSSVFVAVMINKTARFRWAVWGGWLLATGATALLILFDVGTTVPVWATLLVFVGLGHGVLISSLNLAIQAISKIDDMAHAVAMYTFLRSFGMSLGVSIGGTIFQNVMSHELRILDLPVIIAKEAEGFVAVLKTLPADSAVKLGILQSYAKGTQGVFVVMAAFSGAGLLLSFLIARHSMDQLLKSDHVLDRRPKSFASYQSVQSLQSHVSMQGLVAPRRI